MLKFNRKFYVLLSLFSCLNVNAQENELTCLSGDFYACAVKKDHASDYSVAIADYTEAIRLSPQDSALYFDRAISKHHSDDIFGAVADLDKAIELNPNDADSYRFRSFLRINPSGYKASLADSTEAIRLNPKFTEAFFWRAYVKNLDRDFEGALVDLNQAIALGRVEKDDFFRQNEKDVFFQRAGALVELKRLEAALADYNRVIEIDPSYGKAYVLRARVQNSLGNEREAIDDLTQGINIIEPNRRKWPEVSLVKRDVLLVAFTMRARLRYKMGDVAGGSDDEHAAQLLEHLLD